MTMPQISIKEAVQTAKETLRDVLYSDDPVRSLALEEIELVEQGGHELWAVTLGFHRSKSVSTVQPGALAYFQPPSQVENRVYKTLLIDANTGAFVKMDMRLVQ